MSKSRQYKRVYYPHRTMKCGVGTFTPYEDILVEENPTPVTTRYVDDGRRPVDHSEYFEKKRREREEQARIQYAEKQQRADQLRKSVNLLFKLLTKICEDRAFWEDKVRVGKIVNESSNESYSLPHGFYEMSCYVKKHTKWINDEYYGSFSNALIGVLDDIADIAKKHHCPNHQWASSLFYGQSAVTNSLYGIIIGLKIQSIQNTINYLEEKYLHYKYSEDKPLTGHRNLRR